MVLQRDDEWVTLEGSTSTTPATEPSPSTLASRRGDSIASRVNSSARADLTLELKRFAERESFSQWASDEATEPKHLRAVTGLDLSTPS